MLSTEEVEGGRKLGACDCAVFLNKGGLIGSDEARPLWLNATDCNSWARTFGCSWGWCGTGPDAEACRRGHGCSGPA